MKKIITLLILVVGISSLSAQIPPKDRKMAEELKANRKAYNENLRKGNKGKVEEAKEFDKIYLEVKLIKKGESFRAVLEKSDYDFDSKDQILMFKKLSSLEGEIDNGKMSFVNRLGEMGFKIAAHAVAVIKGAETHFYTFEMNRITKR